MKLGQRVGVVFEGDVTRVEGNGFVHVKDVSGNVARVPSYLLNELEPPFWPPEPGDVWNHLGVTFLVEARGDTIWMLASNGEGSVNPDEVLRMRPGIRLTNRPTKTVYSEFDQD